MGEVERMGLYLSGNQRLGELALISWRLLHGVWWLLR